MDILLKEREQARRRGQWARLRLSCLKYLAVLRASSANNLAYIMEVIFRALFLVALIYIIGQLWRTTFALHGTSLPALTRHIDQEVRSGELAYLLGRPCSYILYNYARYLGERLVRLALCGVVAAIVALIFVGRPHFSLLGVLAWPLMVLLAISIEFVCYFAIGLLAFWTENTQPFSFLFSRLELVLGGVLAPIEIFPQPLRGIAQILPFSTMLYGPSRVLVQFSAGLFGLLVLQQAVTLLVAGLLLTVLYTIAARRVSIHGG